MLIHLFHGQLGQFCMVLLSKVDLCFHLHVICISQASSAVRYCQKYVMPAATLFQTNDSQQLRNFQCWLQSRWQSPCIPPAPPPPGMWLADVCTVFRSLHPCKAAGRDNSE
jgi:hypothetical protein